MASVLKTAREEQGISLREASRATRIKESTLKAFESGRIADTHPAYSEKLLQSYARYLDVKLEASEVVFKKGKRKKKFRARHTVATTSLIKNTLAILVVVAVVGYGGWQLINLLSAPALVIYEPAEDTVVASNRQNIRGKTSPGAEVFINEQSIPSDPNGEFRHSISLRRGVNEISITAVNPLGRESRVTRIVIYQPEHALERPEVVLGQLLWYKYHINNQLSA